MQNSKCKIDVSALRTIKIVGGADTIILHYALCILRLRSV